MAASAGVVFIVALIVVSVITMKLADWIIDSRIGALDRTLGFPLRRRARHPGRRGGRPVFFNWLAGAKAPGLGHRRQVAAAAWNRSAPSSKACCPRIRKRNPEEAQSEEAAPGPARSPRLAHQRAGATLHRDDDANNAAPAADSTRQPRRHTAPAKPTAAVSNPANLARYWRTDASETAGTA